MDISNSDLVHLKNGEPVTVEDLRLKLDNVTFHVIGWSQYQNLPNFSQVIAIRELKEIKDLFTRIINSSKELAEFVATKKIVYHLYFDDYGKASIVICSEIDGIVEWYITLVSV